MIPKNGTFPLLFLKIWLGQVLMSLYVVPALMHKTLNFPWGIQIKDIHRREDNIPAQSLTTTNSGPSLECYFDFHLFHFRAATL